MKSTRAKAAAGVRFGRVMRQCTRTLHDIVRVENSNVRNEIPILVPVRLYENYDLVRWSIS
jgi:hypothetical protein